MTGRIVCLIAAALLFLLSAFGIKALGPVGTAALGLAFLAIAELVATVPFRTTREV